MGCLTQYCLPNYLKHSSHCTQRTILVSIRSFPWGNCGTGRSWVWRGQEGAQSSQLSRFSQTFPARRRRVTGPRELPCGVPGAAGGPDPAAVANCRSGGLGARRRVRFSPIRSAAGGGPPSLHTSPYMHRLQQPALLQPHK